MSFYFTKADILVPCVASFIAATDHRHHQGGGRNENGVRGLPVLSGAVQVGITTITDQSNLKIKWRGSTTATISIKSSPTSTCINRVPNAPPPSPTPLGPQATFYVGTQVSSLCYIFYFSKLQITFFTHPPPPTTSKPLKATK